MWLTTAQVAHRLRCSTRWVRWLARHGELPHEITGANQRLFRRLDVAQYAERRADAEERRRPAQLAAQRPRMVFSALSPRQRDLPGLHQRRLRMVGSGERSDPEAEVKAPQVGVKSRGSEKPRYVNRKIAGGRR